MFALTSKSTTNTFFFGVERDDFCVYRMFALYDVERVIKCKAKNITE